jgi:translation initiation factor 1
MLNNVNNIPMNITATPTAPQPINLITLGPNPPIEPLDPAANAIVDQPTIVHLRIQKRTGRKCLTYIQGLPESLDVKKYTQKLRKLFHCNCTFIEHKTIGPCVQLSGDFREELKVLFVKDGIVKTTKDIKIHGF